MSSGGGEQTLSAPVVAALEHAWAAIRVRHPELPAVVVVLASGSVGTAPGTLKLGHFAAMRWTRAKQDLLPEVFVGGEGLARGPIDVLGTLLHEAAHALAHIRGVQDISRQGRYHNRRFAALSGELGLEVREVGTLGWSDTHVPPVTVDAYAEVIANLREALTIYRRAESGHVGGPGGGGIGPGGTGGGDTIRGPRDPGHRPKSGNGLACACSCGRRIRVAPAVLAQGAITCGRCDSDFRPVIAEP